MRWWKASSYKCTKCEKKFPFEGIRYASDGKTVYCAACQEQLLKQEAMKKKEAEEFAAQKAAKAVPDVVKLICVDCRYKFSYKRGSRVKLICPYCSGKRLMIDETTADRLVEEVSNVQQARERRRMHNAAA